MIDSFDENGTCLIWNRECVRRLGWTQQELAELPDALSVFYPDPQVLQQVHQDVMRADGKFREYTVLAKDGTPRIQQWANFRTPASRSTISVGHDVTEQRTMEAQLRQAQKMDAVGRLTGGIAHDFNNLLTVVMAGAELLRRDQEPGSIGEVITAQILQAAKDGSALVQQLGTFSRRSPLSVDPIDLNDLIDDVTPTLRRLLPETITIRVEHGRAPVHILGDKTALKQILMNLATNARDAIDGRGTIEIATRVMDGPPRGRVRLTVRDTGAGMAPETLDRVFEPFFTTKEPGKGTGLGLATVYGLVAQHDGEVEVHSEPGRGTCVQVDLPTIESSTAPDASADRQEKTKGGNECILLVEDDEGACLIAERALRHLGYDVVIAEDGAEALEHIEAGREFSLILSDVVMPRLTGPELLAKLRERGGPMPAFAFCSGYSPDDDARTTDPNVPLLEKPWTLEQLAMFVRKCLD